MKNGRVIKQKCYFFFMFFVLCMGFVVVVINAQSGYAWNNTRYKSSDITHALYTGDRYWSPCEPSAKYYFFEEVSWNTMDAEVIDSCYGTHDWIADSALRLIVDSGNNEWISKVDWLFSESLPLNELDDIGSAQPKTNFKWGVRNWWYNELGGLSDEEWLKSRCYAQFLHGTFRPDHGMSYISFDSQNKGLPSENFRCGDAYRDKKSHWLVVGTKGHHYWIKYDWDEETQTGTKLLVLDDETPKGRSMGGSDAGWGAYFAQCAAKEAVYNLEYSANTQTHPRYSHSPAGKFEAAAFCLGGMAHYIADLSSPPHTLRPKSAGGDFHDWSSKHAIWDAYAARYLETGFNSEARTNGGPNWQIVDPTTPDSLPELTDELSPYKCAVLNAIKTYSAYDVGYMGQFSTPEMEKNLAQDNPHLYEERMKQLLRWAVYYVACAILHTVSKAKIPERDVAAKVAYHGIPKPYKVIDIQDFNSINRKYQLLKHEYISQYQASENPNMQGYTAFAVLAPLIMVSAISLGAFTINLLLKEEQIASKNKG